MTITVDELLNQRAILEKRIQSTMAPLLRQFRESTGVPVSAVYVSLIETTTLGDAHRNFELGKIEVALELEKLA